MKIITFFIILFGFIFFYHLWKEEPEKLAIPFGLPEISWPKDNPYQQKKAKLGRLLYFDSRLSSDGTISCASCHGLSEGFTDRRIYSKGVHGQQGNRHSPSIINTAYLPFLFWDGRAKSLEDQFKGPIANPKEMTLSSNSHDAYQECHERVRKIQGYRILFKEVFGSENCTIDEIAKAVATFERTILSGNSAYDRFIAGDSSALNLEQKEGYQIFKRVGCANCHIEPLFTNGRFSNIGIGMKKKNPDLGRYEITHDEKDWGAFKVPGLREIQNTYPYMHDGSLKTLEEVVEYYDQGGIPNKNLHPLIRPLHLSEKEKKALVSFLKSLDGEGWQHIKEPVQLPR